MKRNMEKTIYENHPLRVLNPNGDVFGTNWKALFIDSEVPKTHKISPQNSVTARMSLPLNKN